MSYIGRGRTTPLAERAVRVRNACLHDLAQRTGLPAPAAEQLDNVAGTSSLNDAWDWWCATCVREPVLGELSYAYARRRRRSLLVRVAVVGMLIVFALAVTPAPVGS